MLTVHRNRRSKISEVSLVGTSGARELLWYTRGFRLPVLLHGRGNPSWRWIIIMYVPCRIERFYVRFLWREVSRLIVQECLYNRCWTHARLCRLLSKHNVAPPFEYFNCSERMKLDRKVCSKMLNVRTHKRAFRLNNYNVFLNHFQQTVFHTIGVLALYLTLKIAEFCFIHWFTGS